MSQPYRASILTFIPRLTMVSPLYPYAQRADHTTGQKFMELDSNFVDLLIRVRPIFWGWQSRTRRNVRRNAKHVVGTLLIDRN